MTLKADITALRRELVALEARLMQRGCMPFQIRVVNDPEENLDEYRIEPIDEGKTIEIGSMQHREPPAPAEAENKMH
jgi:hypothetical protein